MSRCSIIYNPVSTGFNIEDLKHIVKIFEQYNFSVKLIESRRAHHVQSIIPIENDNADLLVTIGGDGTFGDAIQGFQSCEQNALYSHIATGTSNDICMNFNLDSNPVCSSILILEGEVKPIDVVSVNNHAFGYVSCFGAFTDVPYRTKLSLKQKFGKNGYLISAVPDIFKLLTRNIPMYDISYTKNDQTINTKCLLGAVSNSKGFGSVKIYSDANIDDGIFEVAIIKEINQKLAYSLIRDYFSNNIHLENYSEFIDVFKTDNIDICFNGNPPIMPIDNDGDKAPFILHEKKDTLSYRVNKKIKMLMPH